jgi:hypothetical protein
VPISELLWPANRVDHIGRHGVAPEEFEEVCFGTSLVLRARARGPSPGYYVLGETDAGRQLFCVVIEFSGGEAIPSRPQT